MSAVKEDHDRKVLDRFRKDVRAFLAKEPFGFGDTCDRLSDEDLDIFCTALTHDSFSNEHHDRYPDEIVESYEKLEFYGDAILEYLVCQFIYEKLNVPGSTIEEGIMTEFKQEFVTNRKIRCRMDAYGMRVDKIMLTGKGQSDVKTKKANMADKMWADGFEALVAACCLTRGMEKARDVVSKVILPEDDEIPAITERLLREKREKEVAAQTRQAENPSAPASDSEQSDN